MPETEGKKTTTPIEILKAVVKKPPVKIIDLLLPAENQQKGLAALSAYLDTKAATDDHLTDCEADAEEPRKITNEDVHELQFQFDPSEPDKPVTQNSSTNTSRDTSPVLGFFNPSGKSNPKENNGKETQGPNKQP